MLSLLVILVGLLGEAAPTAPGGHAAPSGPLRRGNSAPSDRLSLAPLSTILDGYEDIEGIDEGKVFL